MYSFNNDYSEGAHPKILEAMMNCNLVQNGGYGLDTHCENARRLDEATWMSILSPAEPRQI